MPVIKATRRLGVLCTIAFVTACGGGGGGSSETPSPAPPTPPPPAVTQLSISPSAPVPVAEVVSAGFESFDPAGGTVAIDKVPGPVFAGAFATDDRLIYLARIMPGSDELEIGAQSTVEALFAYAAPLAPALDEDESLMGRLLGLAEAQALADYIDADPDWATPTAAFEQAYADVLTAAAAEISAPATAASKSLGAFRGKTDTTTTTRKVGLVEGLEEATTDDLLSETARRGVDVFIRSNQDQQTYEVEVVNNNNLRWIAVVTGEDPNLVSNTPDLIKLLDVNGGRTLITLPVGGIPQPVLGDDNPLYGVWLYGFSFDNDSLSNAAREAYGYASAGTSFVVGRVVVDTILGVPCVDVIIDAGIINLREFAEVAINAELAQRSNLAGLATQATVALQESFDEIDLAQCFVEGSAALLPNLASNVRRLSERLLRFVPTIRAVSVIFTTSRLGLQANSELTFQPREEIVRVANLLDSQLVSLDSDQSLPLSFYLDADNLAGKDDAVTEPYTGLCDPEAEQTTCEAVLYDQDPPFPVNLQARCSAAEPVDCVGAELLLLPGGQTNISESLQFDSFGQFVDHDFEVSGVGEYLGSVFLRDIDGAVSTQSFQLQVIRAKPQVQVLGAGAFETDDDAGSLIYNNPAQVACCMSDEQSVTRDFVLANIGAGSGTITSVSVQGDPAFSVALEGPTTLLPLQLETATARVTYTRPAVSPEEPATATLIIAGQLGEKSVYDLVSGPPYAQYSQIRLPLTVAPPPQISVQRASGAIVESGASVTSILYVPVSQASVSETLTISNVGDGVLNLDQAAVDGTGYQLAGTVPTTLATDESMQFELIYTKSAQQEPVDVTFGDSSAEVTHVSPWIGLVQYDGNYVYSFLDTSSDTDCSGAGQRSGALQQVGPSTYVYFFSGQNIVFTRTAQNSLRTTSTITYAEGDGQVTERLNATIDIDGNVSGSATFTYQEGSFSCEGSTTISGQFIG